ncbi:MAG: VOC family protein [Dehalococcoidia bacterium]
MLSGIDHIVVLVRDLESATAGYEALGFTVTPGGEHAGGATHNTLIGFEDGTYFELIAFKDPSKTHDHRWWARLAKGEGLVDYALRAENAEAVVDEARSRGLELAAPVDGSRRRPDGELIAWRSITSGRPIGTSSLPFAIEDVTSREARVPGGSAAKHRLGVTGVAELVIAVRDIHVASRDLETMLGQKPESIEARAEGHGGEALFTTGGHRLRLVEPDGTTVDGASISEHLEARGEGPYEVVLQLENGQATGKLLPLTETNGARIRVWAIRGQPHQ